MSPQQSLSPACNSSSPRLVSSWLPGTLRVLVRSLDAPSSAGVAARQLEFDKVILAHPCLYKYFYKGQDVAPDYPVYTRVTAATQLLANYFDGFSGKRGCTGRCGLTGCGMCESSSPSPVPSKA